MILKPGDRVDTKFGPATVVGFEVLGVSKAWLVYEDSEHSTSRVRCRLDTPSNWSLWESGGDPYFTRSDLQNLA